MSDTISRQDAIDAILDLSDFVSVIELFEYVEEHDLQDKRSGGIIDAIDAVLMLPSEQPKQQWIPCNERLPELGRTVLWCNEHGSVFTSAITWRKGELWTIGNRHRGSRVTAWMPLLEPYNEDRK